MMRDPLQPLPNIYHPVGCSGTLGATGAMATPGKVSTSYDYHIEDENADSRSTSQRQTQTQSQSQSQFSSYPLTEVEIALSSPVYHTTASFPHSPPLERSPSPSSSTTLNKHVASPLRRSPLKYRLQDETLAMDSPPDSPAQSTLRFNEGMTRPIDQMQNGSPPDDYFANRTSFNEEMSTIHEHATPHHQLQPSGMVEPDFTMGLDRTMNEDLTVGDLSTISAIPADMSRFANLRSSPIKTDPSDGWTPKFNRTSLAMSTPATGQRPLQLLSRRSTSSNEDDEPTPRRARNSADSPIDLMNFTGQSNILIPPPGPTPRTSRRSPSGRGAFPIRVNPTPSHRSQASVDRERASGRSPQKSLPDQQVPATPATPASAHSSAQSLNSFGTDLLDFDLGPMATPRSIPTVTPRELETLRSELQSRISGLEATLSGKEAEVHALKKSITDAEIRAGKSGEQLRVERLEKEDLQIQKNELDRRAREMEDVLREVKQNAFVEEREREKLMRQAEEAERRTEESEVKILELSASLDTLRSERVKNSSSSLTSSTEPSTPGQGSPVDVDAAVKHATETVARELHALYKSKHERKVADLKLSYEKRWIKQVDALKAELKESQNDVSRLLTERDATLSGVLVPGQAEAISRMEGQVEELRRWNEDLSAQKKVVEAESAGIKSELDTIKRENETLRVDLESERVEKGELVAQVEVFLTVSAEQEREREAEREAREARDRDRQPASPPRSDTSGDSTASGNTATNHQNSANSVQIPSPNKPRASIVGMSANGRPRPMSMLAKPAATKFGSGIPGPGISGLKQPGNRASMYQKGSLMEGITRMGAGSR